MAGEAIVTGASAGVGRAARAFAEPGFDLAVCPATAADWYTHHIRIRRSMKASLSGNLATMVPGVPHGMAATCAFPDRVSVAMVAEAAMQMGGMVETPTGAKCCKTWPSRRCPPHVTFDPTPALMASVAKDPAAGMAEAKEGVREMPHEFMHREKD